MKDLFWNIFEKSGSIDAFMAYKEYEKNYDKKDAKTDEKSSQLS